tara:strand:- start:2 stop:802 length:801 start_codon:yes stop_codon:yes gene_type:complete
MAGIMHRVHLRGGGMDMGNQTSQDKSANMGGDYGGQGNNNQNSGSDPNKYNANREVVKAAQEAAAAQQTPTKPGFGLGFLKDFNFGDFFNKAYTGTGQFLGATNVPLQAGLLAANIANFRPQFEGDVTTGSSLFGKLGTALFGSYNPNNPAYGFTDEQKQSFMNSLYDPDETKGYSVNELAAKEYAESIAPGIFDSLSLEKTPQEMEQDRIDARKQGGSNKEPVVQELVTMDANSIEKNNIIKEYIAKGYPPDMAEYLYEALHANA